MPRFCGGSRVASVPDTTIVPESGTSSPAITRSSVDLPEPEGPSSAVSLPSGASIETSSRAAKSPNLLDTFSTAIMSRTSGPR